MVTKEKQHFISYADDRPYAVDRIKKQAESFNTFSSISVYNNNNIYDDDFKKKYSYVLKEIDDGEYIIYCDAGCELNNKGMKRYYEYLDMLKESSYGFLSFPLEWNKTAEPPPLNGCTEKVWTIKQLFEYFNININSEIANSPQIAGGILIIKKCENTLKILDGYRKVIEYDDKLTTDYYNKINQHSFFRENRHDQSIWGLLRKIHGTILLDKDETFFYFQRFIDKKTIYNYTDNPERFKYPFWASRKKIN